MPVCPGCGKNRCSDRVGCQIGRQLNRLHNEIADAFVDLMTASEAVGSDLAAEIDHEQQLNAITTLADMLTNKTLLCTEGDEPSSTDQVPRKT